MATLYKTTIGWSKENSAYSLIRYCRTIFDKTVQYKCNSDSGDVEIWTSEKLCLYKSLRSYGLYDGQYVHSMYLEITSKLMFSKG